MGVGESLNASSSVDSRQYDTSVGSPAGRTPCGDIRGRHRCSSSRVLRRNHKPETGVRSVLLLWRVGMWSRVQTTVDFHHRLTGNCSALGRLLLNLDEGPLTFCFKIKSYSYCGVSSKNIKCSSLLKPFPATTVWGLFGRFQVFCTYSWKLKSGMHLKLLNIRRVQELNCLCMWLICARLMSRCLVCSSVKKDDLVRGGSHREAARKWVVVKELAHRFSWVRDP